VNLMKSVRALRIEAGLSQTEFGRQLGMSLPSVQRWETLRPPNGKGLFRLERFCVQHNFPAYAKLFRAAWMEWLEK
jgi:transcriptional regulator with XRE-family HTH domain